MKLSTFFRTAGVAIVSTMLLGCPSPTATTPVSGPAGSVSGPNAVTATVKGIVLDGFGRPVDGVEVSYSNGDNPTIQASNTTRTLTSVGTDLKGQFELQVLNELYSGTMTVTLTKAGYTIKRFTLTLPTLQAIRTALGANYKPNSVVTVTTTNGSAAAAVSTVTVNDQYSGYHVFQEVPLQTIFRLDGEVSGTILVKKNATDPDATAKIPPAGSLVSFVLPSTYSPYVFFAKTDATGKFVYSATGSAATPNAAANPLPSFINTNNNIFGGYGATYSPTFAVQPSGTSQTQVDDSFGYRSYEVAVTNLTIVPKMDTENRSTDLKTLYAYADMKAQISGWTPVTNVDGKIAYMDPLTAGTPTPLTVTFSKAMDTAKSTKVTLAGTTANYTVTAPTLAWDATGTILTITPAVAFQKGDTVIPTLTNFVAADGSALNPVLPTEFKFYVKKGIQPISGNWIDAYGLAQPLALNANIVVTFTDAPASFDTALTYLQDITGAKAIAGVVTLDATAKTLTINPSVNLTAGNTYEVRFKAASSIAGDQPTTQADLTTLGLPIQFKGSSADTIKLIASNTWTNNQVATTSFVVTDNVVLTFDTAIVALLTDKSTPWSAVLKKAGTVVPTAVTLSPDSKTITLDPVDNLDYGAAYTVEFSVYNGLETGSNLTLSGGTALTFTTVAGNQLTAPTLAQDTNRKKIASAGISTYNNGDTSLYVNLTKVAADLGKTTGYGFEFRKVNLDGTPIDKTWTAIAPASAVVTSTISTNDFYTVTLPAAMAGDQIIQLRATATGTGFTSSAPSVALEFKDTTAPILAGTPLKTFPGAVVVPIAAGAVNLALPANASTTADAVYGYTFQLPGAEKMTLPSIQITAPSTVVYADVVLDTAGTTATIYFYVAKAGASPSVPTGVIFNLTVKDAAGAQLDFDTTTAVSDPLKITL